MIKYALSHSNINNIFRGFFSLLVKWLQWPAHHCGPTGTSMKDKAPWCIQWGSFVLAASKWSYGFNNLPAIVVQQVWAWEMRHLGESDGNLLGLLQANGPMASITCPPLWSNGYDYGRYGTLVSPMRIFWTFCKQIVTQCHNADWLEAGKIMAHERDRRIFMKDNLEQSWSKKCLSEEHWIWGKSITEVSIANVGPVHQQTRWFNLYGHFPNFHNLECCHRRCSDGWSWEVLLLLPRWHTPGSP